jgi:hypothetical protein
MAISALLRGVNSDWPVAVHRLLLRLTFLCGRQQRAIAIPLRASADSDQMDL